jgi:TolB protein
MKLIHLLFLALLIFPLQASAQAPAAPLEAGVNPDEVPVTLTIVPSARELDPVAIPKLICSGASASCTTVKDILTKDLTISGFFQVLDERSYITDMNTESLKRTKWDDWFNVGAKYLIKGKIEAAGDLLNVGLRLYDVSGKSIIDLDGQDTSGIKPDQLPKVVHYFVNEVIRAITGTPGLFGSQILFSQKSGKSTRAIYTIGIDGTAKHALAGGSTLNMFPSMTNGSMVYTSFKAGKPDIYINGKRVTRDSRHYRGARLSPDGSVLAVSADDGGQSDLFLMSTSGKIIRRLTKSWWDEVSPTWSPDGSMIAFVSNRSGGPQVYVMNKDGSGMRRVTMAGNYNSTPSFGPDGKIVFAGMDEGHSDIFVTDLEGNISRITQGQGSNKDPAFSPDGRHIVFVSSRGGGWRIWMATAEGRYQFQVTEKAGGYSTLFWVR